jgi:hypothetical protein
MLSTADNQQVSRGNTTNHVSRDQYNINIHVDSDSFSKQAPSFNDAPIDLLTVYFTGREMELAEVAKTLDVVHGDIPTRCVVCGMHGIGKTQLALQFAIRSFDQQRYSHIFWISATTLEKLHAGFADILNLIVHPDRFLVLEQIARVRAARRWLEDSGSISWLMVLDNVDPSTVGFLRENLPRRNRRGNILFTTRTNVVATALARTAGKQHRILELGLPDVEDAMNLLFVESDIDVSAATTSTKRKAEEVVKHVGRLPLAIAHAASFMKQTHKNVDDLLLLFENEDRPQVSIDIMSV